MAKAGHQEETHFLIHLHGAITKDGQMGLFEAHSLVQNPKVTNKGGHCFREAWN
jgi:hypothetical protein